MTFFLIMNRLIKLIIIITEIILSYFILYKNLIILCAFKKTFHISCPMCGITRAFKSILKFNIIKALNYNILILPFIIILLLLNIYLFYDMLKNKNNTEKFLNKLGKHYILIIIILLLSFIINNIKGI